MTPWKNPMHNLSRPFVFPYSKISETRLKCSNCGACCPPKCEHYSVKKRKSFCLEGHRVEKVDGFLCAPSPEMQFSHAVPLRRGHKLNNKAIAKHEIGKVQTVYSCVASQKAVDFLFGRKFDLSKLLTNGEIAPGSFHEKIDVLLASKSQAEFNLAKNSLRIYLNSLFSKIKKLELKK